MKKNVLSMTRVLLSGVLLIVFSGCALLDQVRGWFSPAKGAEGHPMTVGVDEDKDLGPVLVLIDGEPVLYKGEFDAYLTQMLQMYPQLKGVLTPESLPEPLKKNVLQKLIDQELIVAWAKKSRVEQSAEFKKSFEEAIKVVKKHIMIQSFEKSIMDKVEASDSEVRAEFEKNKKRYIKSPGGTSLASIKFDSVEAAEEFFNKVEGKEKQFEELAQKESSENFRSFGRIDKDSTFPGLPDAVKNAALAVNKFPALKTVKDDKTTWVICVADRTETEYKGLDEVKGDIELMIRSQKFQKEVEKRVESLKKEHKVEIKEEHLKNGAKLNGMEDEEASSPSVSA